MISCDEALLLMSARLDNELDEEGARTLDAHLTDCTACRALLAEFEEMHAILPGLYESPPPDLKKNIMAAVAGSKVTPFQAEKKRWDMRSWAALAAVCAVALLGAGALHLLPLSSSGEKSAPMAVMAAPRAAPPTITGGAESGDISDVVPDSGGNGTTAMQAYMGILILPYTVAPDLSDYPRVRVADECSYTIPAADFALLAQELAQLSNVEFTSSGARISPDADLGLIVVTGVPTDS